MANKKHLTIAVTGHYVNNLNLIPPSFDIDDGYIYTVHNSPVINTREHNGEIYVDTNFDYHIDIPSSIDQDYVSLIPDKYIGFERLSKIAQYGKFISFKKQTNCSLMMPKVFTKQYGNLDSVTAPHGLDCCGIPSCSKVVIKPSFGARGNNHIVAYTSMLSDILKRKEATIGELREIYPELIISDGSDDDYKIFEVPNSFVVTEYMTTIKNEYRLLVSGPDIYIRPRKITVGEYPQGSIKGGPINNLPLVEYTNIKVTLDSELSEQLYKFIEYMDFRLGSIDLFETTDGEWGIFEWSPQYAHLGANPNWITNLHKYAIAEIVRKKMNG